MTRRRRRPGFVRGLVEGFFAGVRDSQAVAEATEPASTEHHAENDPVEGWLYGEAARQAQREWAQGGLEYRNAQLAKINGPQQSQDDAESQYLAEVACSAAAPWLQPGGLGFVPDDTVQADGSTSLRMDPSSPAKMLSDPEDE